MNQKKFGELIANKREMLGFSQGTLAKTIGVSRPYISQIESGAKKAGPETIIKIMSALNIPIEDLYDAGSPEEISEEEMVLLGSTMPFITKIAEYLTPIQFTEVMSLLSRSMEAQSSVQVDLKKEPMLVGPEGWQGLSKEDKRLVQRIVNRLNKSMETLE